MPTRTLGPLLLGASLAACGGGAASPVRGVDLVAQGLALASGRGAPQDHARAVELFRRACEGGHPPGCTYLAFAADGGHGMPRDPAAAARLFQKACDGGQAPACLELGVRTERGTGGARDYAAAAVLYQRACDGGSPAACTLLGS